MKRITNYKEQNYICNALHSDFSICVFKYKPTAFYELLLFFYVTINLEKMIILSIIIVILFRIPKIFLSI